MEARKTELNILGPIRNFIYRPQNSSGSNYYKSGWPIFYIHFPRCVKQENFRLRPMSIFDGRIMNNGLRKKDILSSNGFSGPALNSWFSVWRWLKKTYDVLYCIDVGSYCIGFIGLHNVKVYSERSAEMSLAIFDDKNRRCGYGTKAFTLLVQKLEQYHLDIKVRVRGDNQAALSFWSKLGFKEQYCNPAINN